MKRQLGFVAILVLSSSGAMAQSIYSSDKDFIAKASGTNEFEIASSRLALQVSKNEKIRAFAAQMIAAHTAAERSLRSAVNVKGATVGLDAPRMSVMDNLKATSRGDSDADFNRAYIDAQDKAHSDAIGLLSEYKADGKDAALVHWADQTLPVVKRHEADVERLNGQSNWAL